MSRLDTYRLITDGITKDDIEFSEAIKQLDAEIKGEFYTPKLSTMNRFNQRAVGVIPDTQQPINVVGLVDFRNHSITLNELAGEKTYNLDDFDPRYLRVLNQNVQGSSRNPDTLPVSRFALDLLDKEIDAPDDTKLPLNELEAPSTGVTGTRRQLQQAFANEMVLLNQLDEFVQKNNLESVAGEHKDKLLHLVDAKAFDQSFNDACHELAEESKEILSLR